MIPETIRQTELHRVLGAAPLADCQTRFVVWSPDHAQVTVVLPRGKREISLEKTPGGYHVGVVDDCVAGEHYFYRVDGGPPRPDPASRFQPQGVHGPSEVVARDFDWTDGAWQGVDRKDLVVYELHIGTFTQAGTFASAIDRLDELAQLGVTAIELMPVSASAGRWNWGYDGVNWFAPLSAYGTPDDLRRLIDAAHAKGLAVILDVVYNHLGPEGNYLSEFGPYLSDRHNTVWGAAPNFDHPTFGTEVRRFVIANALYWYDEFHFDGLRVDAIHCMRDDSETHIAADISRAAKDWSAAAGRPAMLIAESNVYDPEMITPLGDGGIGFDAQWCDDFLHSLFAFVRPGDHLCHRTYETSDLKQTLEMGYVYEGTLRNERGRCAPGDRVSTEGLVYSIQHHDFIGNHPLGKRLHQLTSKKVQRAAAALLLLSPGIPMLFMGEEFCCERPFQFFVDFGDEHLRTAVVEGRKREYPQHDWEHGVLPTDPAAFHTSQIGTLEDHDVEMRDWYASLIKLRKQWKASGLLCDANLRVNTDQDRGLFVLSYQSPHESVDIAVRLSETTDASIETPFIDQPISAKGKLVLDSLGQIDGDTLAPNHAKVFHRSSQ
ncbi:malto-oligosyltrehalose trehalohydrolase [Planctomycetes bacterium K23_9]|uniref:Malto-oligosyltrehalose trehalohydrolase n=1 Tax=Stieleria marina TaxID=1930275 RepID=A0A517P2I5_9BACT|nr:Malto-oligosyltrehalose trehalohydrolase [Planctomycetes bacterium K23_9]